MTTPGFMDDQDVIERTLVHVRNGTTDEGEEVWREPVVNFSPSLAVTRGTLHRGGRAPCHEQRLGG